MEKLSSEQSETSDRVLEFDLSAELRHGIAVSNLAYALSKELGLPHEQCYDLAIAGMLHDIGKLKLRSYINGQESNPMVIEELKYVRMHSTLGYEELKDQGYSDFVLESILYHHENYDGSGYPSNLAGKEIPIDLEVFLAFQRVVHASQAGKYGGHMALKKKPVTGMKDILPKEMEVRNYVTGLIRETYGSFGFTSIETPGVEHIENLCSKQGGDNEKLIFKILKRGEKLKLDQAKEEADLVDSGLRYDLTVPLSRYYSNNSNELPGPFKALQMGYVWRADRPQRGRFRQFMQCDIDILGEPTYMAEIELVLATTTLLGKLDFHNFTIRINDRRILKAMAEYSGFPEESFDTVFIILDKMDKIGLEGVAKELEEEGFAKESIDTYLAMFKEISSDIQGVRYCKEKLADVLDEQIAADLETIISTVEAVKTADFKMAFDPTLVRGMSYYTGPIFEISMDEFGGSVGGGGRYDEMIGKFTGNSTSACGFSIGFERIVMLLLERGYQIPTAKTKKAYLIEKNMPSDKLIEIFRQAEEERKTGVQVNISIMKKNKKFQKDQMTAEGYTEFVEFFKR